MKNDLLKLVDKIDDIKKWFHSNGVNGMPQIEKIYDIPAFSIWKQEIFFELQDIYDRTNDKFIWRTLTVLNQGFNGWKDVTSFNELTGSLLTIEKNIDKFYPDELLVKEMEEPAMIEKETKIFISHSTLDKEYAALFVELLEDIGLNQQQIFCSSTPGYGIPLNQDIYSYLKSEFEHYNLHIIFFLSKNYYDSVACMNEMGAAWALQNTYTIVLLPGFEFKEIEGAINPRQIGLKLDNDIIDIKEKLGQLKDNLKKEFGIVGPADITWETKRDKFIQKITTHK